MIIKLLVSTALVLGLSSASANSNKVHTDIVGGTVAAIGEFPFIVSLQSKGFGHFCGGSLIKKNWVLTAAHCVGERIDSVVIGMHSLKDSRNSESIAVKRVIAHPNYNESTTDYDFALLELATESAFEPIDLNTSEIDIPAGGASFMATVAGWGVTKEDSYSLPNLLQKVDVPLLSHAACNAAYDGAITDRMLCAGYDAGGKDSCQGDSGGPMVATSIDHHRYLIGIVSWGEGCARAGHPGIYSKVSYAAPWIAKTAN